MKKVLYTVAALLAFSPILTTLVKTNPRTNGEVKAGFDKEDSPVMFPMPSLEDTTSAKSGERVKLNYSARDPDKIARITLYVNDKIYSNDKEKDAGFMGGWQYLDSSHEAFRLGKNKLEITIEDTLGHVTSSKPVHVYLKK